MGIFIMTENQLGTKILDFAFEIHTELGRRAEVGRGPAARSCETSLNPALVDKSKTWLLDQLRRGTS
jgi:hypothetical protein